MSGIDEIPGICEWAANVSGGRQSAREGVANALARIEALDAAGPNLNAMVTLNPSALEEAAAIDRMVSQGRNPGPLAGVLLLVKDNIDVAGLPVTGGSASLRSLMAIEDAPVVARLKAAGGIVVGKTSMSEFAWGTFDTENSIVDGPARNPYDPQYASGGSSGGTAVGIAAGYALAGLGTDTGCSVRAPASINALVGLRPTHGTGDMTGIMPMNADWDTVGPLARTVADLGLILDVMLGCDDARYATAAHLASAGGRVGVVRHLASSSDSDPEVLSVFETAVGDFDRANITTVDPIETDIFSIPFNSRLWYRRFRHDLDEYLQARLDRTPHSNLASILASGEVHPRYQDILEAHNQWPHSPGSNPDQDDMDNVRDRYRTVLNDLLTRLELDALVFPTFRFPPVKNGGVPTGQSGNLPPVGSNNYYASLTGFPALSVPMGYTRNGLPLGLQMLGAPNCEEKLLRVAAAYEQATHHRRSPRL
ncbi:MAG: amidase [Gammaproteobacteria bacterium]|jgi:amidase